MNPKLDAGCNPFKDLSTGGLAYKLAPALLERFDRHADPEQWLDLATLSTVADVVPLRRENRQLVHDGLTAIRRTTRPACEPS